MAKILVIEDNAVNMTLISAVLGINGHVVLGARLALDGIALACSEAPDLILMDIELPGMDGLEATAILKGAGATAHIPVVALTAFAMKGDEARFRAAGCDEYMAKPYDYVELLALVEMILGRPSADGRAADG